jgi:hypothetical protein
MVFLFFQLKNFNIQASEESMKDGHSFEPFSISGDKWDIDRKINNSIATIDQTYLGKNSLIIGYR